MVGIYVCRESIRCGYETFSSKYTLHFIQENNTCSAVFPADCKNISLYSSDIIMTSSRQYHDITLTVLKPHTASM